jgi:hypothetical protein
MPYSPEEYEQLKASYKKDLAEQQAFLEKMRLLRLRQRSEWHLRQMEASLRQLGIEPEDTPPVEGQAPSADLSPTSSEETPPPDKTLL